MNEIPSKIWWKMQPLFVLYFKFYSNSYKHKISHQIFYFLLFYVSFYTSRHHFSQIIRTSFTIIWKKKKIFLANFPFSTDSLKPLHPLNGQNPLSVTKVFCRCSLMAFFFFFFQNKRLHGHSYQMVQNFWGLHMNISEFDKNFPIFYNITITV